MPGEWLVPAILFMFLEIINRRYVIFLPLSIVSFLLSGYLVVSAWWSAWFKIGILNPPQSIIGLLTLWALLAFISALVCLICIRRQRRRRTRSRWVQPIRSLAPSSDLRASLCEQALSSTRQDYARTWQCNLLQGHHAQTVRQRIDAPQSSGLFHVRSVRSALGW